MFILSILNLQAELLLEPSNLFKSACIFLNAEGCIKSLDPSLGFIVLYHFVFYVKM